MSVQVQGIDRSSQDISMSAVRLPVAFVCHGGGPLPVISPEMQSQLPQHLVALGKRMHACKPKAILVVSAHYEVCLQLCSDVLQRYRISDQMDQAHTCMQRAGSIVCSLWDIESKQCDI